MFLKKCLLFMTALALLMFAEQGQASAQLSLALGEGGSTTVSGSGTEITVDVSQMGVDASVSAIEVVFDINTDVVTLTGGTAGSFIAFPVVGGNTASFGSITGAMPVPASASFTFTTASDVTGVEFSIGVSSVSLDGNALQVPLPAALTFNAGSGTPPSDDLSGSLTTSDSVNNVGASQEIDVAVAVLGLTGKTAGAEIVFAVNPAVATITNVTPASGLRVLESNGTSITVGGVPVTMLGGLYATVTFTTNDDVTAETAFSIGVSSFTVFTEDGMRKSVGTTTPLEVNAAPPVTLGNYTTRILTSLSPAGGTAQLELEQEVSGLGADRAVLSFSLPDNPEGMTISSEGRVATVTLTNAGTMRVKVEAEVDGFVASHTITEDLSLSIVRERWLELRDVESELKSLQRGELDRLTQKSTFPSAGPDDYNKNVRLTKKASVEIVARGFDVSDNVKLDHTVKVGNIGTIVAGCVGSDPHCWTVTATSKSLDDIVNAFVSLTASEIGNEENTTDEVDLTFNTRPELHWYMPEAANKKETNSWQPYAASWDIVVPVHGSPPQWWKKRGEQMVIIKPMGFKPGVKISIDFDHTAGKASVDAHWDEVKREYQLTTMGRGTADVVVKANDENGNMTTPQPVNFKLYPLTLELDPAPLKDDVATTVSVVRPNYVESTIPTAVTMTLPRHGAKEVKIVAKGFFTFDKNIGFNVMATKEGESGASEVTDGNKTPGFKRSIEDSVLTLMVSQTGVVTVTASEVDGGDTYSANSASANSEGIPLTITFLSPKPWLVVDADSWRLKGDMDDWRLKEDADSWQDLKDRGSLELANKHVSSAVDTIPYSDPGAGDDALNVQWYLDAKKTIVIPGNPLRLDHNGIVTVVARGFASGSDIDFPFEVEVTGSGTIEHQVVQDSVLILKATGPATVRLSATDRLSADKDIDTTEQTTINFVSARPELRSDKVGDLEWTHDKKWRGIIPADGVFKTTLSTIGLKSPITFVTDPSGANDLVSYDWNDQDRSLTLTARSGEEDSIQAVLYAFSGDRNDPSRRTLNKTITLLQTPHVLADPGVVEIPSPVTMPHERSITVEAVNFSAGANVEFNLKVIEGDSSSIKRSQEGHVLTLTSSYAATVEITATDGTTITDPITVTFNEEVLPAPAAPSNVVVEDVAEDNGHYVMISFTNSEDHETVSQYRIYREMAVGDGSTQEWVSWAIVDAVSGDSDMTRAVIPVPDGMATRWGVAAEGGMPSGEEVITPSGKRVFSKESVQLLVEILGVDPNRVVTEDALSEMLMPSAEYINSIIGDRKNVVFAALDPDLSVLIGGDLAVPQNIRTDGSGPIVSSPITATEDMVAAMDNTAPAAVTDVAADVETGTVTWTASADDGGMDAVMYRGHAIMIPHVTGYIIRGGSEDAMIDIGVAPAGSTTFQVPLTLIESLINQGLPAVLVTVTAMDGTNMTPSVPLVVELIPTRKPFVDADGGPVYVVKLDRHGAMTPLVVDFEDFIAFTMAFNTDETHEDWRVFVQADLDDNKMVNFEDFILFFSSYGKEATGPAGKSLVTPVLGVNENAEFSLRLGSDRVVAGENMFVDVSLANAQALMGYGFVLHYDAEKFEFVKAVPAAEDLLKSAGGETPLFRGWSDEAGQVRVMNAIWNGSEVSGGGDIVRLVFRVLRDFEDNARFEIADGLVFDPSQSANPLVGGVLDIQTTPTEFALLQNFPNPFNPDTTIGYELSESADVTLQIYNVVGQVVRTLMAAESQSVGRYQVRWDGMDDRGTPVSSGIYFYQISAGKFQDVRKLMLLK